MTGTSRLGKQLFHVEQLPDGGLGVFTKETPEGCLKAQDEEVYKLVNMDILVNMNGEVAESGYKAHVSKT